MNLYQGTATIRQGTVAVEGECVVETTDGPRFDRNSRWAGKLVYQPTVNLNDGAAWLRLGNGREGRITIDRAVAGSGLIEFSGTEGIFDLN